MTTHLVVSKSLVPSAAIVESDSERAHYRAAFLALWQGPRTRDDHGKRGDAFPGCNPVGLTRSRLAQLHATEYVAALKSDGVRYALFLTTRADAREDDVVALMIDRAWTMYEVEVMAPQDYFVRGTILDGELVWRQPRETKLVFLVFDCVASKGTVLTSRPFHERLAEAARCTRLSEELAACEGDDLDERILEADAVVIAQYEPRLLVAPKRFVARSHAAALWRDRGDADHRVDGLILQRRDAAYVSGAARDASVLKWKAYPTVDLHDDGATRDGPLPHTLAGRRVVLERSEVTASPGGILEYLVDARADDHVRLFPLRVRTDKPCANAAFVVAATVESAVRAVTIDDLCAAY